jgi:hypothetical protein
LLGAVGAAVGCQPAAPGRYLLTVTKADGMSVIDDTGLVVRASRPVVAATPGWSRMVTATPSNADTVVAVEDRRGERYKILLGGRLEPRIISPDGRLVASVTPGGAGIHGLHNAGGRGRTTIVVSGADGETARLDLPGNLEPEAFSPDGRLLYVMDFLPPDRPDRYRTAVVDLPSRSLTPLDEQPTQAHRVVRVHDPGRNRLLAICAREGQAYVDCLDLARHTSRRVDLPAPFGGGRPGVHSLALSPAGDRLCAVHSLSAAVAEIDPESLVLKGISTFTAAPQDGKPGVAFTGEGRLVVSVDGRVVLTGPHRELPTPGEPRGLVAGPGNRVWAGFPDGVSCFDQRTGAEVGRIVIPGLYLLRQVSDG